MNTQPMSADNFWSIIEHTNKFAADPDAQEKALRDALLKLTLDQIVAYEIAFYQHLNAAYSLDLWGAAYVIHGYCSYDRFQDFRSWLVARGRATYEAALANPDSLANMDLRPGPNGYWEFEAMFYVAAHVYKEKAGEGELRDQHSEREPGLYSRDPTGNAFEESEEHLSARYPKLWKRFGSQPLP